MTAVWAAAPGGLVRRAGEEDEIAVGILHGQGSVLRAFAALKLIKEDAEDNRIEGRVSLRCPCGS